ncbi:hypothetical protein H8E07_22750, partial [bacterium]|nr:hypothetical protein [bacterium]
MRCLRCRSFPALALMLLVLQASGGRSAVTGDHVVISWNDLGMHCMNKDHGAMSILPPYNTLYAQVVARGDAITLPQLLTSGVTVEYSIPGNTYSVGKTDFWDHDLALFGDDLPDNVGLTGNGLSGEFEAHAAHFTAEGIPLTPFTDAAPTVEAPYQLGLVIARNGGGLELARSRPVLPVSTEVNCVTSGCHSSEQDIIYGHPNEAGYNPAAQPILCAGCHASPALGTPGIPDAGYFSFRIHDQHKFLDETMPGQDGCNMCHPGPQTQCLRGTMATDYAMVCQDCHGNLAQVSGSIEHQGRVPWLNEPACRECHTAQYGEPVGQLYRLSTGHGGLMCAACHGSPHSIWPSREANDNVMAEDLQNASGTLRDCTVCHGVVPDGPGPHGYSPTTDVVELEITEDGRLQV